MGRSDRFLGTLLFAFFLSVYLITGSGHGYSSDGDFAYRFAGSLIADPEHEYLKGMFSRVSHWGFVVPVMSQPLVLVGGPLAREMPRKDEVTVDGIKLQLGYYRALGLKDEDPTVGPSTSRAGDSYDRRDLSGGSYRSLMVVSFLTRSGQIVQGTPVAEISVVDGSGETIKFPIRAGVETAEWDLGKSSGGASHGAAPIASVWSGNGAGRDFYTELKFDRVVQPREIEIRYLQPSGGFYLRGLALLDREAGRVESVGADQPFWTERENFEFFNRLFFSPYNAIVTALGCVLLFAVARVLRYGQKVSAVATLVYGLATLAWPYSKYDFTEPTLVLFVLASLYFVLRWDRERRDLLMLAAGTMAFLATGTKYASGVIVPMLLLQVVLLHWERYPSLRRLAGAVRPVLLFCVPFLLVAVPAVWFLYSRYGYWPSLLQSVDGITGGWFPLPLWIGLSGLLFSPGRSFFLYSPPTLLALFSVVAFVRRHGLRAVAILLIILFYFGPAYSMKVAWHAGSGWGPRYQVLVIPLVILLAAPLIQRAVEERHRWARAAVVATFALGIALQLLAVAKSYDVYLGMFRYEIVGQLPEQGAPYGGADYYPYSEGLDDGNVLTATMLAWPFSPILAQAWLVSADIVATGPSFLRPATEAVLSNPPWKLFWGIDAAPAHPEYGLGADLWSMKLKKDFPSNGSVLAGLFTVLLLLETAIVAAGAGLAAALFEGSRRRRLVVWVWVVGAIVMLAGFDVMHLLM